jgi:hypothetical protein
VQNNKGDYKGYFENGLLSERDNGYSPLLMTTAGLPTYTGISKTTNLTYQGGCH